MSRSSSTINTRAEFMGSLRRTLRYQTRSGVSNSPALGREHGVAPRRRLAASIRPAGEREGPAPLGRRAELPTAALRAARRARAARAPPPPPAPSPRRARRAPRRTPRRTARGGRRQSGAAGPSTALRRAAGGAPLARARPATAPSSGRGPPRAGGARLPRAGRAGQA